MSISRKLCCGYLKELPLLLGSFEYPVHTHLLKMKRNMWEIHFEDVLTGQSVIQGDVEEKKNYTANIQTTK